MIKLNQTVYLKTINNLAGRDVKIFSATVKSIGRKYFTLESKEKSFLDRSKFELETMREYSTFSPNYQVYLTLEEAENSHKQPIERRKTVDMVSNLNYKDLIKVQEFINNL